MTPTVRALRFGADADSRGRCYERSPVLGGAMLGGGLLHAGEIHVHAYADANLIFNLCGGVVGWWTSWSVASLGLVCRRCARHSVGWARCSCGLVAVRVRGVRISVPRRGRRSSGGGAENRGGLGRESVCRSGLASPTVGVGRPPAGGRAGVA